MRSGLGWIKGSARTWPHCVTRHLRLANPIENPFKETGRSVFFRWCLKAACSTARLLPYGGPGVSALEVTECFLHSCCTDCRMGHSQGRRWIWGGTPSIPLPCGHEFTTQGCFLLRNKSNPKAKHSRRWELCFWRGCPNTQRSAAQHRAVFLPHPTAVGKNFCPCQKALNFLPVCQSRGARGPCSSAPIAAEGLLGPQVLLLPGEQTRPAGWLSASPPFAFSIS